METREDLGYVESDPEINRRIRNFLDNSNLDSIVEKAYQIASKPFSPLQKRESLTVREIKNRLSEIGEAGYDLKPYSHMKKKEVKTYFFEVKRDLIERLNLSRR